MVKIGGGRLAMDIKLTFTTGGRCEGTAVRDSDANNAKYMQSCAV